jgi:hypothetical protein
MRPTPLSPSSVDHRPNLEMSTAHIRTSRAIDDRRAEMRGEEAGHYWCGRLTFSSDLCVLLAPPAAALFSHTKARSRRQRDIDIKVRLGSDTSVETMPEAALRGSSTHEEEGAVGLVGRECKEEERPS